MKRAKRRHNNCKWGGGEFNALPRMFLRGQVLSALSPYGCKLLFDLLAQYNGFNNGDLSITWKLMQKRSWHSKATLEKTTKELLGIGLLELTRRGHRRQCHLYAITLYNIDECSGKLDVNPTSTPSKLWLQHEPVIPIPKLQAQCKKRSEGLQNT